MDIVDAALGAGEMTDDLEDETDTDAFGDPQLSLIGYGDAGANPLRQGWAQDYPDVGTRHVTNAEALPDAVADADYAILVGDRDDHGLAAAIGGRLPDGTTSIVVPIGTAEAPVAGVGTANATVPCPRAHARELVTDFLTVLTGRARVSPPPQFYDRLRTVGRVHGFRGERERADSPADQFAAKLVDDALANPFDAEGGDASERFFSFLRADDAVTLGTFDALRNEITDRFGADTGLGSFAVDTTGDSGAGYRLTLLRS